MDRTAVRMGNLFLLGMAIFIMISPLSGAQTRLPRKSFRLNEPKAWLKAGHAASKRAWNETESGKPIGAVSSDLPEDDDPDDNHGDADLPSTNNQLSQKTSPAPTNISYNDEDWIDRNGGLVDDEGHPKEDLSGYPAVRRTSSTKVQPRRLGTSPVTRSPATVYGEEENFESVTATKVTTETRLESRQTTTASPIVTATTELLDQDEESAAYGGTPQPRELSRSPQSVPYGSDEEEEIEQSTTTHAVRTKTRVKARKTTATTASSTASPTVTVRKVLDQEEESFAYGGPSATTAQPRQLTGAPQAAIYGEEEEEDEGQSTTTHTVRTKKRVKATVVMTTSTMTSRVVGKPQRPSYDADEAVKEEATDGFKSTPATVRDLAVGHTGTRRRTTMMNGEEASMFISSVNGSSGSNDQDGKTDEEGEDSWHIGAVLVPVQQEATRRTVVVGGSMSASGHVQASGSCSSSSSGGSSSQQGGSASVSTSHGNMSSSFPALQGISTSSSVHTQSALHQSASTNRSSASQTSGSGSSSSNESDEPDEDDDSSGGGQSDQQTSGRNGITSAAYKGGQPRPNYNFAASQGRSLGGGFGQGGSGWGNSMSFNIAPPPMPPNPPEPFIMSIPPPPNPPSIPGIDMNIPGPPPFPSMPSVPSMPQIQFPAFPEMPSFGNNVGWGGGGGGRQGWSSR
ncbi:hypothetical protein BV898_03295 [Hypsibius exemplaris]|uniref:Uncharacterized protein n=1 Tax=Hypsibius exemplaris TaxID=2072580 RepID=A0A1W0X5V2_HYPEX|nr:hypothetical protein BV898_03295 [Hypsibius exemplaris]